MKPASFTVNDEFMDDMVSWKNPSLNKRTNQHREEHSL